MIRDYAYPILGIALGIAVGASIARADEAASDPHAAHRAMLEQTAQPAKSDEGIAIPDVTLVTQHGATVSFKDDVIGDNIVVIDFVYTTCTTICPVLSAVLGQVQDSLGDRLGNEVVMASVTVDPMRDTPARLNSYSAKHGARDGWLWLTGDQSTIKDVLTEFGVYTPNFEDHPSMVLIGDGRTGEWRRLLGFPAAEQIVKHIDAFAAAREHAAMGHGAMNHGSMDHSTMDHAAMGHDMSGAHAGH